MKNIFKIAFFSTILCAYGACGDSNKAAKAATVIALPANIDTIPSAVKLQLNEVLNCYYDLKNALILDDATTANAKASALLMKLDKVDNSQLNKVQTDFYVPLVATIKDNASGMASTTTLKMQRERLNALSENLFAVAKAFKVNSEPSYQQFCPMANEGKGAFWISKDKAVQNPYYGKEMLRCGKVTETLN